MSSTSYQPANSRWRPTLPERLPSTAATRGIGLAGLITMLFGLSMMGLNFCAFLLFRHESASEWVATMEATCVVMFFLAAAAAAAAWWWSWRQVTSEVSGKRG